jgi:hypothetical protein
VPRVTRAKVKIPLSLDKAVEELLAVKPKRPRKEE